MSVRETVFVTFELYSVADDVSTTCIRELMVTSCVNSSSYELIVFIWVDTSLPYQIAWIWHTPMSHPYLLAWIWHTPISIHINMTHTHIYSHWWVDMRWWELMVMRCVMMKFERFTNPVSERAHEPSLHRTCYELCMRQCSWALFTMMFLTLLSALVTTSTETCIGKGSWVRYSSCVTGSLLVLRNECCINSSCVTRHVLEMAHEPSWHKMSLYSTRYAGRVTNQLHRTSNELMSPF